ncbi:hypothetical protein [Galbitalea soli]|uniref:Uncharacterized protein n=1 Tax=Galbitalea soli TaxID=1268042 RepID=A0A7C9TR95_9MICO|nr:hypothetical protein [Galbitalea soli]NEM90863.1 hypothetical protein [Galbitalea soli]NYJ31583.1 hypothetical protein [Galbitalea soli]
MIRLLAGAADLLLRRVTGSPLRRTRRYSILVVAVLCGSGISLGSSVAATQHYGGHRGVDSYLLPPAMAIVLALAAGLLVILAEAVRDKSGRLEGALSALPLGRRHIAIVVWAPVVTLLAGVGMLMIPPAISALVALGQPLGSAIRGVVASLSFGIFLGGVSLAVSHFLLRSGRWNGVRYPVAMMLWIVLGVVDIGYSLGALADSDPSGVGLLVMPLLITELARGTSFSIPLTMLCVVLALGALALLATSLSGAGASGRAGRVRLRWRAGDQLSRVVAETLYYLREPTTAANVISAFLVGVSVAVVMWLLPPRLATQLLVPALYGIALFAAAPVRVLRGVFPRRHPPQQLIGMSARSWTRTQWSAALLLVALAAVPAIAAIVLPQPNRPESILTFVSAISLSTACALVAGWVAPVQLDNALGQVIATVLTSSVTALLLGMLRSSHAGAPLQALIGLAALLLSGALIHRTEARRWGDRVAPPPTHAHQRKSEL